MCYKMRRFEKAVEDKKQRQTQQDLEIFVDEQRKILLNSGVENRKRPTKTSRDKAETTKR